MTRVTTFCLLITFYTVYTYFFGLYFYYTGPKPAQHKDHNKTAYTKLKPKLPLLKLGLREKVKGKQMSVGEAFDSGLLHFNPLQLQNKEGEKFSLQEAAVLGMADPHTIRALYRTVEPNCLGRLLDNGEIDPETMDCVDGESGIKMKLAQAIEVGRLDADKVFYMEKPSRNILTLGAAIDEGKLNVDNGKFTDPNSGQEMTLAEAIKQRVIDPDVNADKLTNQVCAVKCLKEHMNMKSKWVKDPLSEDTLTVEDAIFEGVIDLGTVDYVNIAAKTHEGTFIPQAVDDKCVSLKVAKGIMGAVGKMALGNLIALDHIDSDTGRFTHPDTKRVMTIQEATEHGFIEPSVIFFEDVPNKRITSLYAHIADGRFNPKVGKFRDPVSKKEVTIAYAVKKKIINPHVDGEKYLVNKKVLKDLIKNGKIDSSAAMFTTPNGDNIPLRKALAEGYLSPESLVKVDNKTGFISLVNDGSRAAAEALMETKKKLDWVASIEDTLAVASKPAEDNDEITQLLTSLDVSSGVCVVHWVCVWVGGGREFVFHSGVTLWWVGYYYSLDLKVLVVNS